MIEHLTFNFYIILFLLSIIGYGLFSYYIIANGNLSLNFGWYGLIGFFVISTLSVFTSFFLHHGYIHNFVIHLLGIIFFFYFFYKKKFYQELKILFFLTLIVWIGVYVFKNHDDFPYYHLTYSLNLSENGFLIGSGNLGHGYRTFSSIFYFHSILYMPFIKYYLFFIGPFYLLIFFNYIILNEIHSFFRKNKFDFIFYYNLLSLIFINVVFYRIGEHGTDRSAQLLLLIIFSLFLQIIYFEQKEIKIKINLILILIFFTSSLKAIYYLYLVLIPFIFFKKKESLKYLINKNFFLIFLLSSSLSLNLTTSFLSTGCFLYPAEKTCFQKSWSIPKDEVKKMSIHYEWWAKAGGGPNYKHELKKNDYIKNFNWLENWFKRHFFNKVSDTLLAIIFICTLVYYSFIFYSNNLSFKKSKLDFLPYLIIIFFILEWFFKHPSMRYGGYVLLALPCIIFTASKLSLRAINKKSFKIITITLIVLTFLTYNIRNFYRINKEQLIYKTNLLSTPFYYLPKVNSEIIFDNDNFKIYKPINNMCWASNTPCSYRENLIIAKIFWLKAIIKLRKP